MKGFDDKAKHIFKRVQELLVGKEVAHVIIYGKFLVVSFFSAIICCIML